MGILTDSMQKLVDEIHNSTESRRVELSEIKSDTHNLLERFELERQDMANVLKETAEALREKLSSDEEGRSQATQQLLEDARSDLQEMANVLRKKLASDRKAGSQATQQLLEASRSDLQEMANALRKKLASDMRQLASDERARSRAAQQFFQDTRADLQEMAESLREKLSSDEGARSQATQQFIGGLASDRLQAREVWSRSSEGIAIKVVVEAAPPSYETQVLDVIAKNPDGVKLVDIGNELGVDWRSLIGSTKLLLDAGKIEKIDSFYYPKK